MEVRNLNENENGGVSLELAVKGPEWDAFLETASRTLQEKKPVPGFETGAAPLDEAVKHYGGELLQAAANAAGMQLLAEVCNEKGFAPVSAPDMDVTALDRGQFAVRCGFQDYPRVTELDYRGLKPEKPLKIAKDGDVNASIARYMYLHLWEHEVDRPAHMEDYAVISYTAVADDGVPFDNDHAEEKKILLGEEQVFEGLDEAIVKHCAGEELDLTLTMPEKYLHRYIAGKTLSVKVKILKVIARDMMACTDDYVRDHVPGANNVAEFREQRRKRLQDIYDKESEKRYRRNLEQALADAVKIPIPGVMIDTAYQGYFKTLQDVAQQRNVTVDDQLAADGMTMAAFEKRYRALAEKHTRISLALDFIARQENLQVTEEMMHARIAKTAQAGRVSMEEALRRLGGAETLYEQILNDLAMQIVAETAQPQIVEVDQYPPLY